MPESASGGGGVSSGGVRGVYCRGCLLQGVSALGGVCSAGVCSGGEGVCGIPACTEADTPPVNRMTGRCKNIALATTSLRPVNIFQVNVTIAIKPRPRPTFATQNDTYCTLTSI